MHWLQFLHVDKIQYHQPPDTPEFYFCLRIGAAIVVDVQRSSKVFSQLIFNTQCFLIFENATTAPDKWEEVSVDRNIVHVKLPFWELQCSVILTYAS